MIKDLYVFSKYSDNQASLRCRIFAIIQLSPILNELSVRYNSLLLSPLYCSGLSVDNFFSYSIIFYAYIKRLLAILSLCITLPKALVFIHEELLPGFPAFFQVFLLKLLAYRHKLVIDVDDGLHLRRSFFNPFRAAFAYYPKYVDCIICGSPLLQKYYKALTANTKPVFLFPTVPNSVFIPPSSYCLAKSPYYLEGASESCRLIGISNQLSQSGLLKIGWIGSPSTTKFILRLASLIESSHLRNSVRFIVVGAVVDAHLPVIAFSCQWSPVIENIFFENIDVGVMPLFRGCFERYKCSFKLIQYLASGVPCIGSPIGFNRIILRYPFAIRASTKNDWIYSIDVLANKTNSELSLLSQSAFDFYSQELHPNNYLAPIESCLSRLMSY